MHATTDARRKNDAPVRQALQHLVDASKTVLSILETDALLEELMDRALELTRADRGFLMLADDTGTLKFRVGRRVDRSQLDGDDPAISHSVAHEVFRNRRSIMSTNVLGDDALRTRQSVLELQLQTVMCAPLIAKGQPLGVLYVDSSRLRAESDASAFVVFQALADLAAIALENARLYELATTDAKTGIANSAVLRNRLEEAIAAARGGGPPLGLVLIDLDRFKRVNDNYGHPAGDRVLIEVAAILRASVRTRDLAARWGGEEFAVLLDGDGDEDFAAVAERIRRQIEGRPFVLADGTTLAVTASLGLATYPATEAADGDALLELADRCLYEAKRSGRNRLIVHGAAAIAG